MRSAWWLGCVCGASFSTLLALACADCTGSSAQPASSHDGAPPDSLVSDSGVDSTTDANVGDVSEVSVDEGTDAGVDAHDETVAVGSRAPWCPTTPPEAGTPCGPGVLTQCEYGNDPRCTVIAGCSWTPDASAWIVFGPDPTCAGNPAGCPATFDAGAGGACPVAGDCMYPEGRCACGVCNLGGVCNPWCAPGLDAGDDAGHIWGWKCDPWPSQPGCPSPRPLLGTACAASQAAVTCNFTCYCDPVNVGPSEQCWQGYWDYVHGGC